MASPQYVFWGVLISDHKSIVENFTSADSCLVFMYLVWDYFTVFFTF